MIEKFEYDLIVIGGGPGGYVAAIRAAQLGLKVMCIEKRKTLGGTCLNVGCIPSKTLLYSSHLYNLSKNHLKDYGINFCKEPTLDLKKMMQNKTDAINKLTNGVESLLRKNKVTFLNGTAIILDKNYVEVIGKKYKTSAILIATGSTPTEIPGIDIDEKNIVSSSGALDFNKVPKSLAVIGGGYIGLELGSVWSRLGSKVTIIEFTKSIVPTMDRETATIFLKTLQGQKINFLFNTKVFNAKKNSNFVELKCQQTDSNETKIYDFEKVLVAVGRKPYLKGLEIDRLGIKKNKDGTIKVDEKFCTSIDGIYAIGDIIQGPMLAHKASAEGHVFAEKLVGNNPDINYGSIPAVIYTEPEVAWVGPTEQELEEKNVPFKKGVFPFTANARGKTTGDTTGYIKVLSHPTNDRILATHIIGAHAGELIAEAVTALEAGLSAEDISLICHAHPTLSESMKEAASLASSGKTLHF